MNAERKKMVQDGQGELKRLIEETIENGTLMNERTVQKNFQSMFNDIIQSVREKFLLVDCLNQAFNFIYTNYSIYERDCLLDRQMLIAEHLQWLIELTERQISIDDASKFSQNRGIFSAYQQSSYIEEQSFNPDLSNSYSLDAIDNLVYLNKNILHQQFNDYCNNQTENKRSHSNANQHLILIRKVMDIVGNSFGREKDSPIQTYHFQKQIRQLIKEQRCSTENPQHRTDDDMILQMSKCFQRLANHITKEIHEGQIDSDKIQRIVGEIHNIIIAT